VLLPNRQASGYAGAGPSAAPYGGDSDGPCFILNPRNRHLVRGPGSEPRRIASRVIPPPAFPMMCSMQNTERRMSLATNESGSAVLCTLPHTRFGTYIRRTPAGGGWGNQNRPGLVWAWWHHPRPHATHNRDKRRVRALCTGSSDPMREAGEPSTTRRVCCIVLCPSHRG
jgi:hypothetical protein